MKLTESEIQTIERARRYVEANKKIRKITLAYGIGFLAMSAWFAYRLIGKVENLEGATEGFFFGFGLSIMASTFGMVGILFILRSGMSADRSITSQGLLIKLYDELNKSRN